MKLSVKNLFNAGKATTPKPKATTTTAYKKHGLLIASALLVAAATADDAGAPDGLRGALRRDVDPAPQGLGGSAGEEGPPAPRRLPGKPDGLGWSTTPDNIAMINVPVDLTGGDPVTICLVDSGYDEGHPDLPEEMSTTDEMTDKVGQGTHIAGIIGALGKHNQAVRGILTDPTKFTFHVAKVPPTLNSDVAVVALNQCVRWNEAGIISFSSSVPIDDKDLEDALQRAYNGGALIVAPAGDEYVGVYPTVMSVASVGPNRSLTECIAHEQVEISAPGLDIPSTCSRHDEECKGVSGPCYCTKTGTEYAAAHVAGVAAFLMIHFPHCTNNQIRNAMLRSASEPDDFSGYRNPNDWDQYYGWGIVDARAAAERLKQEECKGRAPSLSDLALGGRWQRQGCGTWGRAKCDEDNDDFAPCCDGTECAILGGHGEGWCGCAPLGEMCSFGSADLPCCEGSCVLAFKTGATVCQKATEDAL